jgi:PAS domain S-box-containing protein
MTISNRPHSPVLNQPLSQELESLCDDRQHQEPPRAVQSALANAEHLRRSHAELMWTSANLEGANHVATNLAEDAVQTSEALRESEERYRQLANLLPVAVYTCNAAGVITYYNPQAARLWGRAPKPGDTDERFCGSEQMLLPGGLVLPHDQCPMAVALRDGSSFREQAVDIRRPDGSQISVRVNIDPITDSSGRIVGAINVFHDVTDLNRTEQALRESEERFRMLADNMAQLAWTCDKLGNCTWYNKRWLEYTGLAFEDMMGWDWSKVHHPDHLERVVARVKSSAETGEPWEDTFPLRGKDGVYRWFLSRAYPIRDEQGSIIRWFGTNTDIDDQRRAEESLREADRRKDEFLGMLAHELRNPLAAISNAVQVVQHKGNDAETVRWATELVSRQVRHMVRQVDDLLDVSRIGRGKIELCMERIELATVVNHAVEAVSPLCENRRHELTVKLPSDPMLVEGDAVRLTQVVGNLLNNACKFTDGGGRIWLTVEQEGEQAVIRVRDTGVGIGASDLHRIFEVFTQADTSLERSREGLGLGLALVKSLVELHGGAVEAHSAGHGQGSEFVVRLPLV